MTVDLSKPVWKTVTPAPRVLAFVDFDPGKQNTPHWWYRKHNGKWCAEGGQSYKRIDASRLTIAEHPMNDAAAIEILTRPPEPQVQWEPHDQQSGLDLIMERKGGFSIKRGEIERYIIGVGFAGFITGAGYVKTFKECSDEWTHVDTSNPVSRPRTPVAVQVEATN